MSLRMCDEDIVRRAHNLMNAVSVSILKTKATKVGHKDQHSFTLSGQRAIGWMMMLWPFMGERRKARIKEVLALWQTQGARPKGGIRPTCGHVGRRVGLGLCRPCWNVARRVS